MSKRQPPLCDLSRRLGDHLFQVRDGRNLEKFCREVGLSKSSLARIELGAQNLTVKTLQTICDRLHCDIADLFPRRSRPPVVDRRQPGEEERP